MTAATEFCGDAGCIGVRDGPAMVVVCVQIARLTACFRLCPSGVCGSRCVGEKVASVMLVVALVLQLVGESTD